MDLKCKDMLKSYTEIDIGFVAENFLKEAKSKKVVSDKGILEFKLQCKEVIVVLLSKLLAKTPLNYDLVLCLSCLDPIEICNKDSDYNVGLFR